MIGYIDYWKWEKCLFKLLRLDFCGRFRVRFWPHRWRKLVLDLSLLLSLIVLKSDRWGGWVIRSCDDFEIWRMFWVHFEHIIVVLELLVVILLHDWAWFFEDRLANLLYGVRWSRVRCGIIVEFDLRWSYDLLDELLICLLFRLWELHLLLFDFLKHAKLSLFLTPTLSLCHNWCLLRLDCSSLLNFLFFLFKLIFFDYYGAFYWSVPTSSVRLPHADWFWGKRCSRDHYK